ncbi:sigma-70 family RNA polymerase sigma factor [Myxococcota bacterium]|nr:sigma-70 family RNA polymerase sigma factor [Myxococcota bacterium]
MDRQTLTEMYETYGYAVHKRCWRLLGSKAEADDALQEVFMRAMKYGEGFSGEAPLPWLYRIADRHCFDVLKRKKRRATEPDTDKVVDTLDARGARSDEPSPERVRTAAQILAACSEPVQDVAVLYFVDEMTQEEVADAVGVSRKTVRERLAKFLEKARDMLQLPAGTTEGA